MACIKPKLQKVKRCSNPDTIAGYNPTVSIAIDGSLITFPSAPVYVESMTGVERLTAVCADATKPFGTDAVWYEYQSKKDKIKVTTKPKSNLIDSKAVVSVIEFEMDVDKTASGQASLLKGQDVHVVLSKAGDGALEWYGRKNNPAIVKNVEVTKGSDMDTIKMEIEYTPYDPLFLPDTAVINYGA